LPVAGSETLFTAGASRTVATAFCRCGNP
jgi:hypothetical protein